MKIHVLGSLSGMEPHVNRHHTSWVLELDNGSLYWFDAGECCSETAYLMGMDLFNLRAVFISHPHYDHFGGLLNLFSVYRKMYAIEHDTTERSFEIFMPVDDLWEPFKDICCKVAAYPCCVEVNDHVLSDGGFFKNDEIMVEFMGNRHIAVEEEEPFKSFSFRITAENKTIVYSGDLGSTEELLEWSRNCDCLLMESGHHHPWEVCQYWQDNSCNIGKVIFMHHGRDVIYMPTETAIRCRRVIGNKVFFAEDRQCWEL